MNICHENEMFLLNSQKKSCNYLLQNFIESLKEKKKKKDRLLTSGKNRVKSFFFLLIIIFHTDDCANILMLQGWVTLFTNAP